MRDMIALKEGGAPAESSLDDVGGGVGVVVECHRLLHPLPMLPVSKASWGVNTYTNSIQINILKIYILNTQIYYEFIRILCNILFINKNTQFIKS